MTVVSRLGRLAALSLLATLVACAGNPAPSTFEELGADANTSGFGRRFPAAAGDEYVFTYGVGDQLLVEVADFPELSSQAIVRQDGTIQLGLLGSVQVGGLTSEQVQRKVATLATRFVTSPEVAVTDIQIVSTKVFVGAIDLRVGAMAFQAVPFRSDLTLFDLWVDIGSPSTALDDIQAVQVIRGDPRFPQVRTINLEDMVRTGRTGANIRLRPDDIVFIPPSWLGRINQFLATVSLPLQPLTQLSRNILSIEQTIRVIEGDQGNFSRILL